MNIFNLPSLCCSGWICFSLSHTEADGLRLWPPFWQVKQCQINFLLCHKSTYQISSKSDSVVCKCFINQPCPLQTAFIYHKFGTENMFKQNISAYLLTDNVSTWLSMINVFAVSALTGTEVTCSMWHNMWYLSRIYVWCMPLYAHHPSWLPPCDLCVYINVALPSV